MLEKQTFEREGILLSEARARSYVIISFRSKVATPITVSAPP